MLGRKQIYKCRYCEKENYGKLYCNNSHKSEYYRKLRNVKFNAKSPEQFIKEELAKPINELCLKVEKVTYMPNRKGGMTNDFIKFFSWLNENMKLKDIRRLKDDDKYNRISYYRSLCHKHGLKIQIFSRTVNGIKYLYFKKEEQNEKEN